MTRRLCRLRYVAPVLLLVAWAGTRGAGWGQEPVTPSSAEAAPAVERPAVTVAEARRQAELLHTTVHAALQLTHHRFYREDEGLPIPADVIDEVFREVESEHGVRLRWLAVEGQAMNKDHVARGRFEEEAVAALKSGKKSHEQTDEGVYRRAGPITLGNQCLKCHVPDRRSTRDRTAGLVISIPVTKP